MLLLQPACKGKRPPQDYAQAPPAPLFQSGKGCPLTQSYLEAGMMKEEEMHLQKVRGDFPAYLCFQKNEGVRGDFPDG